MRVEHELHGTTVVLSRRNLLSLLAKLDGHPPDSACTIVGGTDTAPGYAVRAEEDGVHYYGRPPGGEMHPDTEGQLGKIDPEFASNFE